MRISSYIKKLPFFQLGEGVYPQLCQSVLVLFICLIYRFSIPLRYFTHIVRVIYFVRGGDILWTCANIYTQQWNIFICAEKKNRQTNRETNTNLRIDFLDKPGGGGALIFFVRVADVYWRCQKIYPNSTQFYFVRKNKLRDKQTNKQIFF